MRAASRAQLYWVLGLALLVRLCMCVWAWGRVPPTADGAFYHVVAQRIAEGKGYTWLWPDGVVTFAAHYPVGYPGAMAALYWLFGPVPGAIMLLNAVLGTAGVWASYGVGRSLILRGRYRGYAHRGALGAAALVAVSPTFVAYTPALMTEGAVGALLVIALRLVTARSVYSRAYNGFRVLCLVLLLTASTYLRPQSILFAPVLGAFLMRGAALPRVALGLTVFLLTLVCVAPWTARNCDKMGRCVFVSANGGWNLLIGTFPEGNGAWVPLVGERVPVSCRAVYREAEKDECFGAAGLRRISTEPGTWLALVPAKLRATVDFGALSAAHLRESGALSEGRDVPLKWLEIAWQRVTFLLIGLGGLVRALGSSADDLPRWRKWLLLGLFVGVVAGICGLGAWWAWVAIALMWSSAGGLRDPVVGTGIFSVLSTLLVHAVFFGASRYFLPVMMVTAPLVAVGIVHIYTFWEGADAGRSRGESAEDF